MHEVSIDTTKAAPNIDNVEPTSTSPPPPDSTKTNKFPINLSFSNISYSVEIKQKKHKATVTKLILSNITGQVKVGSLLAIMGPTGSGKTSLLNILAKRCPRTQNGALTGSLSVNNSPVKDKSFYRLTSYVMQDDAMFAELTVLETLMIAAQFQLSKHLSLKQKEEYVMSIINELGLIKAMNTIIGDARNRGVSGGERKRANIGVELIKNPSCLFLDEPTSGLDSFQAQSVMQCLQVSERASEAACSSESDTLRTRFSAERSGKPSAADKGGFLNLSQHILSNSTSTILHSDARQKQQNRRGQHPPAPKLNLCNVRQASPPQ